VVLEAKEKSGTMSTVAHAERYGKPVCALRSEAGAQPWAAGPTLQRSAPVYQINPLLYRPLLLGVRSGLPTAALLGVLMRLELSGRVTCLPGKRYILR